MGASEGEVLAVLEAEFVPGHSPTPRTGVGETLGARSRSGFRANTPNWRGNQHRAAIAQRAA
jgi:hypothetical protein